MPNDLDQLTLNRPKLLSRAAQIGACSYNREKHLKHALRSGYLPAPKAAFRRLIEVEATLDQERQTSFATYRVARHVEVLIALLGEFNLVRSSGGQPT